MNCVFTCTGGIEILALSRIIVRLTTTELPLYLSGQSTGLESTVMSVQIPPGAAHFFFEKGKSELV